MIQSMNNLDRIDLALLNELQRDARQTVQQLAEAVGLSGTPCWKRVKAMEEAGVILGYTARIDRDKVGLSQCVMAEINLDRHAEDGVRLFEQAVAASPQIVSCYATTGAADYVIQVLVADIQGYERFLHDTAFKLPGVSHVRSSVVLRELKSAVRLPIAEPAATARSGDAASPARSSRTAPARPRRAPRA